MFSVEIPDKLYKEIETYCTFNKIENIEDFCVKMLIQGFNIERFGTSPFNKKPIFPIVEEEKVKQETVFETKQEKQEEKIKKVRIIKR